MGESSYICRQIEYNIHIITKDPYDSVSISNSYSIAHCPDDGL